MLIDSMKLNLLVTALGILFSIYETEAGFINEPCSERNTAYLSLSKDLFPSRVQCADITGLAKNIEKLRNISNVKRNMLRTADSLFANHMNLTEVPMEVFVMLPEVTFVDLTGNFLKRIPRNLDKYATQINKLLLADNRIIGGKKRPIVQSSTLKTLVLSHNKIKRINVNSFSKLPLLEVLFLDSNKLTAVSPQIFKPLTNLKFLHLGNNFIQYLPPKNRLPPNLKFYIVKNNKALVKV